MSSCSTHTKELSKVKEIWKGLTYDDHYEDLEYENVLKILADEEIINIVKKYKDKDISKAVAGYIIDSIFFLDDKETILKMSRIIGSDKNLYSDSMALSLCDVLNTLEESNAKKFINWAYDAEILGYTPHTGYHFYDALKNTIESSKECNVKDYSFEGENGDSLNYSKEELLRYSIISIMGSKDKILEAEAENAIIEIVGKTILNKAKNSFNTKYKYTQDEFNKKHKSDLLKNIFKNFRQHTYEDAYKLLNNTNDHAICDVLNAVNYKDVDIANTNFIRATESNNPLDYDNKTQLVCVYLPLGANNDEIIRYCNDDSILLIRYDIGGKTLGSAICAFQDDIFLVDSVEGHRTTRKDKVFEIIYNDLISRAKMKNTKRIIFNRTVFNETPKKFIEYIGKKDIEETVIDIDIDICTFETYSMEDDDEHKGYLIELE